jgi:zinc protease
MFEKEGFYEDDLTSIKARNETGFYNSFSSVLNKSFTLAQYETFKDDPEYFMEDLTEPRQSHRMTSRQFMKNI